MKKTKKSRARRDPGETGETPHRTQPLTLSELLRSLPEAELGAMVKRLRIKLDPRKRIDPPTQVARALVLLKELREPSRMAPDVRELLLRIAESGGVLAVDSLPPAVQPLMARAIVFARARDDGRLELILPVAFLLQLKTWEGEDPRCLRALLEQTSPTAAASVVAHYLGKTPAASLPLALEECWAEVTNIERLRKELDQLAPLERRLLTSIEELGGEVDTEELLNLEREPMRLRGAAGATPSRRGIGFALERRGFLVPIHPNRHVIPAEVSELVGAKLREERRAHRLEIKKLVLDEFHSPRRAVFGEDAVPLALAMAMAVREQVTELKPDVGVPRSLLSRLGARFGQDLETVAFVAALSRSVGLWAPGASDPAAPPGSSSVAELSAALFEAWQRGGAWDEALPDGDTLRVSRSIRDSSVIGVIRNMLLEALSELGDDRWVPWEALAGFIRTDSRTPGLNRLIERWAARGGFEAISPAEVARRITFDSLHALGIVDLGESEDELETGDVFMGPTVRVTARGRALLKREPLPERPGSAFSDNQALRVGPEVKVGYLLSVQQFVEPGRVTRELELLVTPSTLAAALSSGVPAEDIQVALERIAPLPDPLQRQLLQAGTVLGRAEFVGCEGFLWVEDPEIRQLLLTRRGSSDLFIEPSPPSGLLVASGVDMDRLTRRCRALGVEIVVDGQVYRARSVPPSRRVSVTNGSKRRRSNRPQKSA